MFQLTERLKVTWQLILSNINFSFIHIVQDRPYLFILNVFKENNGVFARVLHEKLLEIGGAGTQNHFVAFYGIIVAS